jgi:hypothetical protein
MHALVVARRYTCLVSRQKEKIFFGNYQVCIFFNFMQIKEAQEFAITIYTY